MAGIAGKLQEVVSERVGLEVIPTRDRQLLEAAFDELRATNRELDLLGWQVLDYLGGAPQELNTQSRRKMVQRSRYVWMNDPQAGASVGLMNDFTFGRGVPQPRAKDETVQETLDDFWNDPDNKRALTTYDKQIMLGTDLALQSNLFFLVFDDGDDGRVKLSILDHDTVETYVRDPENQNRVLYWLVKPRTYKWDFKLDRPDMTPTNLTQPLVYYEDWAGMREAEKEKEEGSRTAPIPKAPAARVGKGRIYHIAINHFSGQIFGVPEMQRTIRWYSAYNDFMRARVDIAQASAAYIMKRKVKGSAGQLARLASKAISRSGDIAGAVDSGGSGLAPPRPGAILQENESVSHENFSLDSRASNAKEDAHMIRAPISAATRFPQAYYGDESNTSLATATSLELPVLKAVESRQEVFEQLFRDMLDAVIGRAVDTGKISEERTPEELEKELGPQAGMAIAAAASRAEQGGGKVLSSHHRVVGSRREGYTLRTTVAYEVEVDGALVLREAHEDATVDEEQTKRDLGYEFSMPSPLRRMMGDLVQAIQGLAATFDPNNTNLELTKALATIAFGEALEIQDPADLVAKIWPDGYVDPMIAAAQEQTRAAAPNPFGPDAVGTPVPSGPDSEPQSARLPEELRSGPYNAMEAELREALESGDKERADEIRARMQALVEGLPERNDLVQARVRARTEEVGALFDTEVASVALAALRNELPEEVA